jgi:hypothetical protein
VRRRARRGGGDNMVGNARDSVVVGRGDAFCRQYERASWSIRRSR